MQEDQNSRLSAFGESENWLLPTCRLWDCFTRLLCAWAAPCPSLEDAPGPWELSIQELGMKEHGCLLGRSRTSGPGGMEFVSGSI